MAKPLLEKDLPYLEECVKLAKEAYDQGDAPFGSVLVNHRGDILAKSRNRDISLHAMAHPELELAHWALKNLSAKERKEATMYTSGEHCPMCGGANGWAGIGTVVYLCAGKQLKSWLYRIKAPIPPVAFIPLARVAPGIELRGPASHADSKAWKLLKETRELQILFNRKIV